MNCCPRQLSAYLQADLSQALSASATRDHTVAVGDSVC